MPRSYLEAVVQDHDWKDAINEELNTLKDSETLKKPERTEIIDSKWLFSQKIVEGKVKRKA